MASDHGEPIAQFFQIGSFLFHNNLATNAHGNGYSDPNFVIPSTIGGVLIDNYNARDGDHSINLAVTYDVKDRLAPFIAAISDVRDGSLAAGWSPHDFSKRVAGSAGSLRQRLSKTARGETTSTRSTRCESGNFADTN
ncbi:MAG TPA: hypothetical protein VK638_53620 [Edaphobacter sp.]|nr:hypothetical protein [Edaphobacter sp.]